MRVSCMSADLTFREFSPLFGAIGQSKAKRFWTLWFTKRYESNFERRAELAGNRSTLAAGARLRAVRPVGGASCRCDTGLAAAGQSRQSNRRTPSWRHGTDWFPAGRPVPFASD